MASHNPEAEEVSRVNKLLQIEDLAWSRQLEKAVSDFLLLIFLILFYSINACFLLLHISFYLYRDSEIPVFLSGMPAVSCEITK